MTPIEKISELEQQIQSAANAKAVIKNALTFTFDPHLRGQLRFHLKLANTQISDARDEIERIETADFVEIARARRAAKYPPILSVKKSTIRFADGFGDSAAVSMPRITGQDGISKIFALGQRTASATAGNYREAR